MILISVELGKDGDWEYHRKDNELLTLSQTELVLSELNLLKSSMHVDGFLCCGVGIGVYPDGCHKQLAHKWRAKDGDEFWTDREAIRQRKLAENR